MAEPVTAGYLVARDVGTVAGRRRVSPVGVGAMETLAVEELVPGVTTPPTRQASGTERRPSFNRLIAQDGTFRMSSQQASEPYGENWCCHCFVACIFLTRICWKPSLTSAKETQSLDTLLFTKGHCVLT